MLQLNDNDFLNLKYMILGVGLLSREDLTNIKDKTALFEELKRRNYGDKFIEEISNECFYYLNCYNFLHENGICPTKYKDKAWGIGINDEIILLMRLYQNIESNDFFHILQTFFDVSESVFRELRMNIKDLNLFAKLPDIKQFLITKKNPFTKEIDQFLEQRSQISGETPKETSSNGEEFVMETSSTGDKPRVKGICLVVSNEEFKKHESRPGTTIDEETITKTFSKLNFDVRIERNVNYQEMEYLFENTKANIKSDHEMFVAFFLSHGDKGLLYTADSLEFTFDNISNYFTSSQCRQLIGKNKLFFFVCCQGNSYNRAVESEKLEFDGPSVTSGESQFRCLVTRSDPDFSDFFFGYATYRTFYSFRRSKTGTLYIEYLCKEINENPKRSLDDIHLAVQNNLSSIPIHDKGVRSYQMSCCLNVLRKKCYLA